MNNTATAALREFAEKWGHQPEDADEPYEGMWSVNKTEECLSDLTALMREELIAYEKSRHVTPQHDYAIVRVDGYLKTRSYILEEDVEKMVSERLKEIEEKAFQAGRNFQRDIDE